ncbi:hypothetical protein DYB32_009807 [Aphanomyces invadans]|uniref:Uncharacterized protein n=1 Tax=Aphanomyces invadans TaxID=157072 RepID=A0A3R7CTN0_9STRA|nr:hypothetical protein DYB32_009807 [Aphanomyces invadans]
MDLQVVVEEVQLVVTVVSLLTMATSCRQVEVEVLQLAAVVVLQLAVVAGLQLVVVAGLQLVVVAGLQLVVVAGLQLDEVVVVLLVLVAELQQDAAAVVQMAAAVDSWEAPCQDRTFIRSGLSGVPYVFSTKGLNLFRR